MQVFIDADGCPVVDITIKIAKQAGKDCVIVCDTSHVFEKDGAKTMTVSRGTDSVDFVLVNMIQKGDIVVKQDFGLAAMCLARGATPISLCCRSCLDPLGRLATADNITPRE